MSEAEETPKTEKIFALEEVKKHTREDDCWLVVDGQVFDVTEFLDEHPGGFDIIISNTGKDATEDFDEIGHSKSARELLSNYKIGAFAGGKPAAAKPNRGSAVRVSSEPGGNNLLVIILKVLMPVVVIAAIFLPRLLKSE